MPRRVAIFIEKTKDGQILPVPNVVVRDVACGANHTVSGQQCSPSLVTIYHCIAFCQFVIAPKKKKKVPFGQLSLLQFAAYTCRTDQQYALKDKFLQYSCCVACTKAAHSPTHCTSLCFTACPGLPEACFLLGLWWLWAARPRRAEG